MCYIVVCKIITNRGKMAISMICGVICGKYQVLMEQTARLG